MDLQDLDVTGHDEEIGEEFNLNVGVDPTQETQEDPAPLLDMEVSTCSIRLGVNSQGSPPFIRYLHMLSKVIAQRMPMFCMLFRSRRFSLFLR